MFSETTTRMERSQSMETPVTVARRARSAEDALVELHRRGLSPIEAIKALRAGRGLTLGEAKVELHASPAWAVQARAAERLHGEICEALGAQRVEDAGPEGTPPA